MGEWENPSEVENEPSPEEVEQALAEVTKALAAFGPRVRLEILEAAAVALQAALPAEPPRRGRWGNAVAMSRASYGTDKGGRNG